VSSVSFRSVKLPAGVKGCLFFYRMPGRYEPLESVWAEVARQGISCIACLAALDEIEQKSAEYARARRAIAALGTRHDFAREIEGEVYKERLPHLRVCSHWRRPRNAASQKVRTPKRRLTIFHPRT
jgi:gamma-glutamylcyclotransferase (GGCT)/AIG2-like uncharacterized protein YtfP